MKNRIHTPPARPLLRPLTLLLAGLLAALPAWGESEPAPQKSRPAQSRTSPKHPGRFWQSRPNFDAPTAAHCQRPPRLIEVPDPSPRPPEQTRRERPVLYDAVGTLHADARSEMSAPAAPAPAPPAPPALSPAPSVAETSPPDSGRQESIDPSMLTRRMSRPADEPVTVGMVDDNADFGAYRQYTARSRVEYSPLDVSERHLLQVRDAQGRPVPDAAITVRAEGGQAAAWLRTDSAGRAWLHPNSFDPQGSARYRVSVQQEAASSGPGAGQPASASATLRRGQKSALEITLPQARPPDAARLDLLFMVDATGSMDDEIDKLKRSLHDIVRQLAQLPSQPDLCLGLVAYRDQGDDFYVRGWDFTNDTDAFQRVLEQLQAGGGSDMPEAMNAALHTAVQQMSWRGPGVSRMLIALADAPPHLDTDEPPYPPQLLAAAGKGIKIFGVGASGLNAQGEFIQRQMAQYTGGRFIFLTYARAGDAQSGPGRETVHDVQNYSVQTLDALIVRLVRDELAHWPDNRRAPARP